MISPINSTLFIACAFIFLSLVATSRGIRCYQCGQYTDGVGSITPCINHTEHHLKECPKSNQHQCIFRVLLLMGNKEAHPGHKKEMLDTFHSKYVTEGSIVRECAAECTEKRESWGTKVFCCAEDACNIATHISSSTMASIMLFVWQLFKITY